MVPSTFAPVSFVFNAISASCRFVAQASAQALRCGITTLKVLSVYMPFYFPVILPTKHQRAEIKTSAPWIPGVFLPASLQTLLKDMIKLSWPASVSSISTGTTGNKPSWSNVSTFIDSKCKLNTGKRQNTRKSYLVSEKPLCLTLLAPMWCSCQQ